MIAAAGDLARHDVAANGHLQRVLTLCGFGVCFTGVSHHGSMGEHQVSHWIDMFAGQAHPGTTHGQQVGVASLAIARLQNEILKMDKPPKIRADPYRGSGIHRPLRRGIGSMCYAEARRRPSTSKVRLHSMTSLNGCGRNCAMNCSLSSWIRPRWRRPSGRPAAPTTATELGLPRKSLARCHEICPRCAQPLVIPRSGG